MSTVSLPSVPLDGAFAWDGCRVEPFCDPSSRISVPAAVAPAVAARERLRRRRAERLVSVPCPRPGSEEPDPSPRLLRPDEPLPPPPDVDAVGESAFPLAAEPRPLPDDFELVEPEEPLRGRSP
jgi:hypothetical protein